MMKLFLVAISLLLVLPAFTQKKRNMAAGTYSTIPLQNNNPANSPLLAQLIENDTMLAGIAAGKASNRLQVIYTIINRDKKNQPVFSHHFYNISDAYFYPASTVKLPASVLALEKLNTLNIAGLNIYSSMLTESLRAGESPVYNDPSADSGKPSLSHYIKKILLVSDNDAYNRLYEFIGQQPLNERLHQLGFTDAQLLHRLSIFLTEEQNRTTNAVRFTDTAGNTLFSQPVQHSALVYQPRTDKLGKGYMAGSSFYSGDKLVNEPFDFSKKNRWRLPYIHQMLQWVMFPESQPASNKLRLTTDDYAFLWKHMSMTPPESKYPYYDSAAYFPAYVKFLMLGNHKGSWPKPGVRIFNKVGDAYGFLIDGAYIIDVENKVEFMLSAMIYCNADGIFNDDKYDYETLGLPFMKQLGQVVYNYELKRHRSRQADLSRYIFDYSK